ncbi:hypothetical protein NPIL_21471 [Nephila pilipes]|uniref:Uncharacterized protein n=1 Tax=Nephila pilipes TaxID=299642 RepID=A0A8X6Q6D5_NEPPI|nr:hypothetical protein NPIL_21471 [Nephila pilipes]
MWDNFSNELDFISNIKVNRCILPFPDVEVIDLHGFGDASEAAFGAVFTVFNNSIFIDIPHCNNKYFKILHILSLILRFENNCKFSKEKRTGYLTRTEITEHILVSFVQAHEFSKEFNALKAIGEVNSESQ